jgi:TatD DNase family protein
MSFINLHTHFYPLSEDETAIVNITSSQIPNSTRSIFYSAGIHPWFLTAENAQSSLSTLDSLLRTGNLIAIGETGYDLLRGAEIVLQDKIFNDVVSLSEFFHKPLIIHCVKAWEQLLKIRKLRKPKQTWILHGFQGNTVVAHQMLKHEIRLSFGVNLLNNKKLQLAFAAVPIDLLFLETDNHNFDIKSLYIHAAAIRSMETNMLKQKLFHNFEQIFLINNSNT